MLNCLVRARMFLKWIMHSVTALPVSRHRVHSRPWYLLSGAKKSGKTQLILNSGLRFLKPECYGTHAVDMVKKFNAYDWYMTHEAVWVDMAALPSQDLTAMQRSFINYLRRKRKIQAINGVIFTISIPQVMLATHQQQREVLQEWADQLTQLYYTLKIAIPIYIVITKSDLISGFCEFFRSLNKEALQQVWGIRFPLAHSSNSDFIESFLNREYNQLIAQLQQRSIVALNLETQQKNRNLIYAFPQQVQLFKKPLLNLVSDLFSLLPQVKMVELRGVYFTSAEQKNEPYDFFFQTIRQRYNLQVPHTEIQESHQESYFIQKLFCNTVLSESEFLGYGRSATPYKIRFYKIASIAALFFLVLSIVLYHIAYKINLKTSSAVMQAVQTYQKTGNHYMLLQAIEHIKAAYQQQSWVKNLLYVTPFFSQALMGLSWPNQHANKMSVEWQQHTFSVINRAWQQQILPAYEQFIQHAYPVDVYARSQLDLNRFTDFFAKEGTLDHFLQKYVVGMPAVHFSEQDRVLFSHLKAIQTTYFNKNHQPHLSFFIKPLILDNSASHATLILGNTMIYYAHGPEQAVYVNWPFTNTIQHTKLIVTDFKGHRDVLVSQGPWSLFHFLEYSQLQRAEDAHHWIVKLRLGQHTISFKVISAQPSGVFQLASLKNLKLPRTL